MWVMNKWVKTMKTKLYLADQKRRILLKLGKMGEQFDILSKTAEFCAKMADRKEVTDQVQRFNVQMDICYKRRALFQSAAEEEKWSLLPMYNKMTQDSFDRAAKEVLKLEKMLGDYETADIA